MTNNILPTDIEFATKLLAANQDDAAIVTALVHRGIESATATQMVADLRNGRKVTPQIPASLEIASGRRSGPKGAGLQGESTQAVQAADPGARRRRSASRSAGGRKQSSSLWIIAAVSISLVAVGLTVLVASHLRHRRDDVPADKAREAASARGSVAPADARVKGPGAQPLTAVPDATSGRITTGGSGIRTEPAAAGRNSQPTKRPGVPPAVKADTRQKPAAPGLALSLQSDGLRISGSLVTAGNVLACVRQVLGQPTRSIPAVQPDTIIYAYDGHGLLIYSAKGTRKDSIVLDCDAVGGANGTTSPFTGSLQVEDQVIRPDTDSKTLAAMPKLGLRNPAAGSAILSGRYNDLDLAFAYLKTPNRLSLIEIDLR